MSSRRVLKAAEAIREVVGMAILTDLRDPRIQDVTVTYVEVSADMRNAKVHVSVMGDDSKQQLSLHGLRNARGYLQQKVSQRIDMRYTPRIQFVLDQGLKNSIEVSRILKEVLPPPIDDNTADHDDLDGDTDDSFRPDNPADDNPRDNYPDGGNGPI
ncbi:MAG: 30S ribosome-binding factor RbfA [Pirellulaceae bacterium]|nr:30S ribosome-binding factor RbfA [Planctomycetales bacterium]